MVIHLDRFENIADSDDESDQDSNVSAKTPKEIMETNHRSVRYPIENLDFSEYILKESNSIH